MQKVNIGAPGSGCGCTRGLYEGLHNLGTPTSDPGHERGRTTRYSPESPSGGESGHVRQGAFAQAVMQPSEVGLAPEFGRKHKKFRNLIAVQLEEASFERGEPARFGLEKEQGFIGRLNLAHSQR